MGLLLVWGVAGSTAAQRLPEFATYPLPGRLAIVPPGDDYFDQVAQDNPVGGLLWSELPITVAIDLAGSRAPRQAVWLGAVRQAIADWNAYLPMIETRDPAQANIVFRRSSVPIRRDQNGKLERIRLAETRFNFFVDDAQRLRHRMTIYLSPSAADAVLLSGAQHELGHALGIWGHSQNPADVMYFAQVAKPVGISARDVRTLKRVYGMQTRLGGKVKDPAS
ncbi:MAG: matrixin family metalloprotease [Alkalinema sp. RL_2_19]|nr:matrixin family metalloprotease [Alkalinema sp. RL_2_19]